MPHMGGFSPEKSPCIQTVICHNINGTKLRVLHCENMEYLVGYMRRVDARLYLQTGLSAVRAKSNATRL